jgi:ureidoacrylate peracid hydrolase
LKFHPKETALLVIDVQNDYAHIDGTFGRAARSNIPKIRRIIKPMQKLVSVCRENGVVVFFIQSTRTVDNCEVNRHKILPATLPGWLGGPRKGTWGAKIVEELEPAKGDQVMEKHRNSGFYRTRLEKALRKRNIQTLLFAGIATNGCVESTLRDAFFRDFDIILVRDCCADQSMSGHLSTLRVVQNFFGVALNSSEIIKEICK